MFAIMGITGQIGGVVARTLLAAGKPVRAIARDAAKGRAWADRGCELTLASIENVAALTSAFSGADGVFVLVPPNFDPTPEFPEARAIAAALRTALDAARPARVVYLSTIGAQASQSNLLTQHTIIDKSSANCRCPWHIPASSLVHGELSMGCGSGARARVIPSFLQPLDKPVANGGYGGYRGVAAGLLREAMERSSSGRTLEGPQRA